MSCAVAVGGFRLAFNAMKASPWDPDIRRAKAVDVCRQRSIIRSGKEQIVWKRQVGRRETPDHLEGGHDDF